MGMDISTEGVLVAEEQLGVKKMQMGKKSDCATQIQAGKEVFTGAESSGESVMS